ncbi:MAG: recombinase family protein [Actinomycetota bacterium]|nr:recombinase family protein [Actinomycetota bacterium]
MASDRPDSPPPAAGAGGAGSSADPGTGQSRAQGAERRGVTIAALYARVSTDKQEKDETIASQLDALQRAAAAGGYAVAPEHVFVDGHHSGARLDRPALDRLRDLAADGTFEAVLVARPDRLARQYAHQVLLIEELTRTGCRVVFLNHAGDETPEQQMLLQIQGVFAEYERELIKERMRRGHLFAARQGRRSWSNPPYGYRYQPKTETAPQQLLVHAVEAEVVRQMYRWLVEEGLSSYAIEQRLVAQQVPTRRGARLGWRQSTVLSILRSPLYKGEAFYNRTMATDARRPHLQKSFKDRRPGNLRSRTQRPRDEWIPIRVPAIIDPETWDLAQAQLARNRDRASRHNTAHAYVLRSLLVCGHCGRRLIGNWGPTGGRYICAARYPRHTPWSCDGRSVQVTRIEPLVWDYVRALLADPALLQARYADGHGDPAVDSREEQERGRLQSKLTALTREVQRLVDAYQAGVIELAELQERRERIANHGQLLRERLAALAAQRADRERQVRLVEGLDAFCASVRAGLEDPSFELKQRILQLVVDRIVVEDERIVVYHVVPTGPVRLQTGQQRTEKVKVRIGHGCPFLGFCTPV